LGWYVIALASLHSGAELIQGPNGQPDVQNEWIDTVEQCGLEGIHQSILLIDAISREWCLGVREWPYAHAESIFADGVRV
jgi:hypothetical protein